MKSRIVIPTAAGQLVSYDIAAHQNGSRGQELKIVFSTSEEPFESWLFYLLREIGGHVVTDRPDQFRQILGLSNGEPGIIDEHQVEDPLLNRHPATL
jgi:hypothetical protein